MRKLAVAAALLLTLASCEPAMACPLFCKFAGFGFSAAKYELPKLAAEHIARHLIAAVFPPLLIASIATDVICTGESILNYQAQHRRLK